MSTETKRCKDVVGEHYASRMADIRRLAYAAGRGSAEADEWSNYALSFDYVVTDQKRGYFRYQLSCGGPSDEFRFYVDERLQLTRIEYWYLDWFDGAKELVRGKNRDLWNLIWSDWLDCGIPQFAMKKRHRFLKLTLP